MKTIIKRKRFSLWFWTLGLILKLIWEPFSKKRSHFWNWREYNNSSFIKEKYFVVANNSRARSRKGLWQLLWQTNFGWQKVIVVKPKLETKYFIIFSGSDSDYQRLEVCDLQISGPVALLLGPEQTRFFAVDENGNQLQLKILALSSKRKLDKKIKII